MFSPCRTWRVLLLLAGLAVAIPGSGRSEGADGGAAAQPDLVDKMANKVRRLLEMVKDARLRTPQDCKNLMKRIDRFARQAEKEMKDLRRAYAGLGKGEKARLDRKGQRVMGRIMQKYTDAVVRFDSQCPEDIDHLEELQESMFLGPGRGHHHHGHDDEEEHGHEHEQQKENSPGPGKKSEK